MTVQNQNVKNVYRGNGSTTVFPFTFAINESHPEYIHVYITNDGGKAAETTDFTCDMETRTITYPKVSSSAPKLSATQRLTIYRLLPYEQNLNLVNQGPFFSEDVETQLDDLEMQIQQLSENLVRCFQIGIEALDFDMTMELEPGKVICVNSDGNGFEAREALMEVNGHWDGEGRQIKGVADPADNQDATTKNYVDDELDTAIENLQLLADIVVDSGELQHITDQFNAIDENTEIASTAAYVASNRATAANNYARNAANSESIATETARALTNYLDNKETLTAPAVDPTLTISGAAADAKVTGERIGQNDTEINEIKYDILEVPVLGKAEGETTGAWARYTLFSGITLRANTKYIFKFTLPSAVTDVTGYAYLVSSGGTDITNVSLANTTSANLIYISSTEQTNVSVKFAFGKANVSVSAEWGLYNGVNAVERIDTDIESIDAEVNRQAFIVAYEGSTGTNGKEHSSTTNNAVSTNKIYVNGKKKVRWELIYAEPQYAQLSHLFYYKDGSIKYFYDYVYTNQGKEIKINGEFDTTDEALYVLFTYYAYTGATLNVWVEREKDQAGCILLARQSLPSYYTDMPTTFTSYEDYAYIDHKIDQIECGKKSFMFFTDTHWEQNSKHCTDLMKYVSLRTNIKDVLYGGDFIERQDDDKYKAAAILKDHMQPCQDAFGNHLISCIGNHDTNMANYPGDDRPSTYLPFEVSVPLFYKLLGERVSMRNELYQDIVDFVDDNVTLTADDLLLYPNKTALKKDLLAYFDSVFYLDDTEGKTRYIVINTGNPAYGAVYTTFGIDQPMDITLQLNWFAWVLQRTPANYNVVLLAHNLVQYANSVWSLLPLASPLARIFRMYALGTSGAVSVGTSRPMLKLWCTTVTVGTSGAYVDHDSYINNNYDFTSRPAHGTLLSVSGHVHQDVILYTNTRGGSFTSEEYNDTITLDQSTAGEIPYIVTATDASGLNPSQMTDGTVTEQRFDVVSIEDTKIAITRFGAGSDRVVKMS